MKFRLQPGETLYNDYIGQRRGAKTAGNLFSNKNENGHIYITSSRVVFTTTQGLLSIVGNITDAFFPALQDIAIEIMISDVVGLKKEKVMKHDYAGIVCKDGTEHIFYAGKGLNNKSGEIMKYIADACNKQGISLIIR